jgi:hypothetical protein
MSGEHTPRRRTIMQQELAEAIETLAAAGEGRLAVAVGQASECVNAHDGLVEQRDELAAALRTARRFVVAGGMTEEEAEFIDATLSTHGSAQTGGAAGKGDGNA